MKATQNELLESFIETIESSQVKRERWLKKVGQFGLDQTLGEYSDLMQTSGRRESNDQQFGNQ